MPDVWEFGAPEDGTSDYSDGTVVPHRRQVVTLNGVPVGELEVHMHRRAGADKVTDVSFGVTAIAYGARQGR